MSLINKVLSRMHTRGAEAPSGAPAARAAHAPTNRVKAALIGAAVLSLACAVAWLWWSTRHKAAAPVRVAPPPPARPISAPQAVSPPVMATSGVEISPATAASQPVAVVTQAVAPPSPVHTGTIGHAPKSASGQEMAVAILSPVPEADATPSPAVRAKPPVPVAKPKRHKAFASPVPAAVPDETSVPNSGVDKQVKPLTVQQQADNEFRRANGLVQQGRTGEALAAYEAALQLDPGHDAARQAMLALLLENKRNADAERVLLDGLKHNVKHSGFAMLLARIQVERDASWSALLTLQKTLPYAEQQADYRAFVAALLQRLGRHKEAVTHYQAAVQLSPNAGVWWMGLGMSMQALQRNEEARVAFRRALDSRTLNADLQAFVERQLREL